MPAAPVDIKPAEKKEAPRYVYSGSKYRDPFIPLAGGSNIVTDSTEIQIPNIANLLVKGIFKEGNNKVALLSSGMLSYVLRENRLYDNRSRLIPGITGVVKTDSVLLIAADKSTKELKLREKE
jgi:hypothetical protein